ncbi:MAG: SMI1/KNR4 family protein [Cyanobacteria bacterium J06636_27]
MTYTENPFDWNSFLRVFSRDLLERLEDDEFTNLAPEIISTKWLGYPGLIQDEIISLENSLETVLPNSYRNFLAASNGWKMLDIEDTKLWSKQQVGWLASKNQELINDWTEFTSEDDSDIPDEEYFVYGEEQDSTSLRNEYLQTALEIGNDGDGGVILLNPQIKFEEEWEAWFFASWLPGAERYKSFQNLIQEKYNYLLECPKLRNINL